MHTYKNISNHAIFVLFLLRLQHKSVTDHSDPGNTGVSSTTKKSCAFLYLGLVSWKKRHAVVEKKEKEGQRFLESIKTTQPPYPTSFGTESQLDSNMEK